MLNDNIEITIIEVFEDQVKLGIRAPKEVSIYRSEIYEKIKQEMQAAAKSYPDTFKPLDAPKSNHISPPPTPPKPK